MKITQAIECQCGAFTLETELEDGSRMDYSMTAETLESTIGKAALTPVLASETYSGCNHCVNNWGVDLCACGSGESPEECDNELEMCGTPMQTLEQPQRTSMWG